MIYIKKIKDKKIKIEKNRKLKKNFFIKIINKKINKIKFCVFLGREKNIKILHSYIEKCLFLNIIDEYHMYDFSKNENDKFFIKKEYNRLSNIFKNKIFLLNTENFYYNNSKTDWNPFYKEISKSKNNDVIIKCDDDILFIDIFALKNAIKDRIKDRKSFLIHSNCINNGVCAYYQSNLFNNINELKIYPTGGLLGVLFEKPEIGYAMHNQFLNDLNDNLLNLNKYIIDDKIINTRISINFILLNGKDAKYLKNVSYDDEYLLSSFYPEKLLRYNKIKGDLITSHLSYSVQNKIIDNKNYLLEKYTKIKDNFMLLNELHLKNNKYKFINNYFIKNNNYFLVKNWFNENHFYIKNFETNKYLYIDYEENILKLSDKRTIFKIELLKSNFIIINLGIYYFSIYNIFGNFKNESVLLKCLRNYNERLIYIEYFDKNIFYLKFRKSNTYLNIDNSSLNHSSIKKSKWQFENVDINTTFFKMSRFIKNNKFYYENIDTKEIYTNFYNGWGIENIINQYQHTPML